MPGAITIKRPKEIRAADLRRFKRDTLGFIALQWHQKFRPLHFTPAGARKYGYAKRNTKNVRSGQVRRTRRGRPLSPSGDPLSWSGESRQLSSRVVIASTSNRARAKYPQLRKLNFRPKYNKRINMREEFSTVLNDELRQLDRAGEKFLRRVLAIHGAKARVRINLRGV